LSSGPRGIAIVPTFAFTTDDAGLVINFLNAGHSQFKLRDGQGATMEVSSLYPADGKVRIKLGLSARSTFAVKVRIPTWSQPVRIAVNGRAEKEATRAGKYATLRREWRDGDVIELNIPIVPRLITGEHGNQGKVAFACGPLVLAADDALNPNAHVGDFEISSAALTSDAFQILPALKDSATWESTQMFSVKAVTKTGATNNAPGKTVNLNLIPFADAGSTLAPYQVWLPCAQSAATNPATRVH
jgi:DUF1680 family protein